MTSTAATGKPALLCADFANRPTLFAATFQVADYLPLCFGFVCAPLDAFVLSGCVTDAFGSSSVPVLEQIGTMGVDLLGDFTL